MAEPQKVVVGNAVLYLGDCREIIATIGRVGHVITDPPYGEKTHLGARGGGGSTVLVDFASITELDFLGITSQLLDITDRWLIMTCEWRHAAEIEKAGLPLVRLGIWHKPNGAPQFTGDRPGTGWEAVAILHNTGKKKWNGGGHHAVWSYPTVRSGSFEACNHPTEKPLPLIQKWLHQFTDKDETVLDPFMGSGSTGVACMNMGRKFIGIEIDPKHFDTACRRIQQSQQQMKLEL